MSGRKVFDYWSIYKFAMCWINVVFYIMHMLEQSYLREEGLGYSAMFPKWNTKQNYYYTRPTAQSNMHPMSVWAGTPPDVMFIECEPLGPHLDEVCTLHLSIKDFCPEDVSVTWTKDGELLQGPGVFSTPPSLNINGRYSMFSFLRLTPSKDDQGSQFVCRVEHSAQKEAEERFFTLPRLHMRDACDGWNNN